MTAELMADWVITEPGVYADMPADVYHADPVPGGSLSSTGARRLLDPSCPALFRHEQDHPEEKAKSKALDFGVVAHQLALGDPEERVRIIDHPDYMTGAAKAARDAAYDEGKTPVLRKQYQEIRRMADRLRDHPIAAALLDANRGRCEQSVFWETKLGNGVVRRRARVDWLRDVGSGRLVLVDYKTSISAAATEFGRRSVLDFGYHQQAAWYRDAAIAVGLDEDPAFVFLVQMKAPPYLVTPIELTEVDLNIGRNRNLAAMMRYADCVRTGQWPGFGFNYETRRYEVETAELPEWYRSQHDEVGR